MKCLACRRSFVQMFFLAFVVAFVVAFPLQCLHAEETNTTELRARFFKLCYVAVAKVTNAESKGPFFADSYAVRALCAAYDLTGEQKLCEAIRWCQRRHMVAIE